MSDTFRLLLPQIVLAVSACLLFLGGSFPVAPRRWGPLALLALLAAAGCLRIADGWADDITLSAGSLVTMDGLSIGFQYCALAISGLFVVLAMSTQAKSETAAEFYGLLLVLTSGLMLVAAANELVLLFLGLELISIPTYVLLYLGRRDLASQEATVKYFLLSVLSAVILLYGFSFIYGLTGTTHLGIIRSILSKTYAVPENGMPPIGGSSLGMVALVLIFAGLGFKIAAVPFHFYAPDVYQGTSAFNAGLLAVVPKAAGFVALIRVANEALVGFETSGERVALILAGITMTGGNCLALWQTNVRRLLAYSSIAHAGYMLVGIAVGFWDSWNPHDSLAAGSGLPGGVQACLLYLLAYCIASVGMFGVLAYLVRPDGRQVEYLEDLTGLARTHPVTAIAAALFLFSMAGIPPLPGFWGKLAVFSSALSVRIGGPGMLPMMHQGFTVLAIVGVLNAAVGCVYYVRLVAIMFLNDPLSRPQPAGGKSAITAVCAAALLLVALGLAPAPVFSFLQHVAPSGVNVVQAEAP